MRYSEVKKYISYNPETGDLIWLPRFDGDGKRWIQFNSKFAGKRAGTLHSKGYFRICISNNLYYAHRLAWLLQTGDWPPHQVDHINGDPADNRWVNLRAVTQQENARNMPIPSNNTSGFIGVSWSKTMNKWQAHIKVDQVKIDIGHFSRKSDAVKARVNAEAEYGFHPNHGRTTAAEAQESGE